MASRIPDLLAALLLRHTLAAVILDFTLSPSIDLILSSVVQFSGLIHPLLRLTDCIWLAGESPLTCRRFDSTHGMSSSMRGMSYSMPVVSSSTCGMSYSMPVVSTSTRRRSSSVPAGSPSVRGRSYSMPVASSSTRGRSSSVPCKLVSLPGQPLPPNREPHRVDQRDAAESIVIPPVIHGSAGRFDQRNDEMSTLC
jgi:hypothetical protein